MFPTAATLHHTTTKAVEEADGLLSPTVRKLTEAYSSLTLDTVGLEQVFNDLRRSEKSTLANWQVNTAQLCAVQIKALQRRYEAQGFNVWHLVGILKRTSRNPAPIHLTCLSDDVVCLLVKLLSRVGGAECTRPAKPDWCNSAHDNHSLIIA